MQDDSPVSSQPEESVNKVNSNLKGSNQMCFECQEPAIDFCRHCGQEYCQNHRSKYQANLCCRCLTDENLQFTNEPLIDDEGVQRHGRRIRLIGEGWPNSIRAIKDMTDEELTSQIGGLKTLLEESVKTGEFARISIAAREYELEYRKNSRYVAAMKRREKIEQGAIRLNSKRVKMGSEPKVASDIKALMDGFGLTYDQAVAMKQVLSTQKG